MVLSNTCVLRPGSSGFLPEALLPRSRKTGLGVTNDDKVTVYYETIMGCANKKAPDGFGNPWPAPILSKGV